MFKNQSSFGIGDYATSPYTSSPADPYSCLQAVYNHNLAYPSNYHQAATSALNTYTSTSQLSSLQSTKAKNSHSSSSSSSGHGVTSASASNADNVNAAAAALLSTLSNNANSYSALYYPYYSAHHYLSNQSLMNSSIDSNSTTSCQK